MIFSLYVLICSISFIDVPNKNSLCALCVMQRIIKAMPYIIAKSSEQVVYSF